MIRNLALSAVLCLATAGAFAQALVIEDFENFDDPGNWQLSQPNNPPNHTLNASVTGNVPLYVTSGTANLAGRFVINWELDSPATGTANHYNSVDGNLFYAARLNINAPSSLPNNAIPTETGLLQADIVNESAYPVQVALVVTNAQVSQLERGPFVTIGGGESIVYSWDFETQVPVGFDTGDGVFSGNAQQVKSLLVYSATAPPAATLSLKVDNIRNGRGGAITVPPAPQPVSLIKGAGAGTAVLTWVAPDSSNITAYNVYVATDDDFGLEAINRLSFSATPAKVVSSTETSTELTELAVDTNLYVAVSAVNGEGESPGSQAFAIRLGSGGSNTLDRLVLDHDAFQPGQVGFSLNGYAHAAVYTAQALGGLNRSFDTVAASGVASGAITLPQADESVVIWSNLLDGTDEPAISPANLAVIQNHISAGGNIIVSGTNVASSIATAGALSLQTVLRASLALQNVGLSSIRPVGHLSAVPALSTVTNVFSDTAAYATSNNDAISPVRGSVELAQYQSVPRSTGLSAGIGYRNRLVFLSFAFESVASEISPVESASLRQNLMDGMINYLQAPTAAADWQLFD